MHGWANDFLPPSLARECEIGKKSTLITSIYFEPSQTCGFLCPSMGYVHLCTKTLTARWQRPHVPSSQDVAFFFSGMGKVAITGLPLCLISRCLEWNSRKGVDGQQGIFLCLVIVGVTNGEMGLLASVTSYSRESGPSCPKMSHRMPFPGTSTSVSLYSSRFSSLPGKKSGSSTVVSSIKLNK